MPKIDEYHTKQLRQQDLPVRSAMQCEMFSDRIIQHHTSQSRLPIYLGTMDWSEKGSPVASHGLQRQTGNPFLRLFHSPHEVERPASKSGFVMVIVQNAGAK